LLHEPYINYITYIYLYYITYIYLYELIRVFERAIVLNLMD
jgi:hypothetical protein